jgi:hypothetical protein
MGKFKFLRTDGKVGLYKLALMTKGCQSPILRTAQHGLIPAQGVAQGLLS